MTRRTILGGGFTVAATLAAGAGDAPASPDPCAALSAGGELDCSTEARAATASDFGHIVHKQPQAVLKPSSPTDIAAATRWAGSKGLRVAARGQGHSIFGRAMADMGVVIDMTRLNKIHRIDDDRIVVDAGTTWQAVLDATLPHGLTPPVLTNYLGLSVGGTLTVGGIGGTTSRHGMQTDNVLELRVVTGDGRELTCSPSSNTDLFDAVRGGLGQCAIITSATLRLVPAPERVLRLQLFYPDLHALATDQRRVLTEGRFDQLQGAVLPDGASGWRYQLEAAVQYDGSAIPEANELLNDLSGDRSAAVISDLTYREDAGLFGRLENLLRSNGQWLYPHPWWLTFLRASNAEQLAVDIVQQLTAADVGPFGRLTFYPMRTNALRCPLVRTPDENVAFVCNIIRLPASNDAGRIERMIADNRMLYDRIRKAGGFLYPVSAFPMRAADWKDHFGSAWQFLSDAKERYDPRHTLTPGYELF